MKKLFKVVAIVLALVMLLGTLAACKSECDKNGHKYVDGVCIVCGAKDPLYVAQTWTDGTELKVSIAHDSLKTTITFEDASVIPEGGLKLADGKTYQVGDLKPVWAELEDRLNVTFTNVYQSGNVQTSYRNWRTNEFVGVDVLLGNASDIAEDGKKGQLLDLSKYLDRMPNFKKFLEENPLVLLSIISDTDTGAIYYAPYFDGYDDVERYFLMRSDWVAKLLDGEGQFTAEQYDEFVSEIAYTPYMPTRGTVKVDALSADGSKVASLTKDYDKAGNPVENQNKLATKNGLTLVNSLRDYIDKAYNGYYGTKRSNLFCGYDAAWDADELVALLRCIVTNTYALTGQNETKVTGIFPRESRLDRAANLLGIASMFGARGMTANQDYLYFDANGNLCDARQDANFYEALGKMNELYKEGLILQNFDTYSGTIYKDMYTKNLGFMLFDYCQTQTLYNEYQNDGRPEGFNLTPVLNPVAKWNDGKTESYMRFCESWRGVKTQGWCATAEVEKDSNKLAAVLALIDFPWSKDGSVLMTYGPEAFLSGTTEYKGEQIPKMSDAYVADFVNLGKGNFTNFARQYIGTTFGIGFVKDQGFEYQCTTAGGKLGSLIVGQAIAKGVIKHISPELGDNLFYSMVPTTLPTTAEEDDTLGGLTALVKNYSKSNKEYGCYIDLIKNGFGGKVASAAVAPLTQLPASADAFAKLAAGKVSDGGFGGITYITLNGDAWGRAFDYYTAFTKVQK